MQAALVPNPAPAPVSSPPSGMTDATRRALEGVFLPVVSLFAALVVFGLFVAATGRDAFEMYGLIYVGAFSDAFIAMSIVAAVGVVVAFWTRDDVLKEHQAQQRSVGVSGFEGGSGGGA